VLAAQSCLNLCDPMDCSPTGFSVHTILQVGKNIGVGYHLLLQGIFLTQRDGMGREVREGFREKKGAQE